VDTPLAPLYANEFYSLTDLRFNTSFLGNCPVIVLSRDIVTVDGAYIGNWIYGTLTSNYSAVANSHTQQFTIALTKPSQSAVSSPVVVW
jgi:hypothetical protein